MAGQTLFQFEHSVSRGCGEVGLVLTVCDGLVPTVYSGWVWTVCDGLVPAVFNGLVRRCAMAWCQQWTTVWCRW